MRRAWWVSVVGWAVLAGVAVSWGTTRGIRVKARLPGGISKEIRLYSGYYALVVGCSEYRSGWPRLRSPVKDAREVAKTLKGMGWKVKLLTNPDSGTLRSALNRLVTGPGRNKEMGILFYFSGHGHTLEEADGTSLGYIVPVDAPNPYDDEFGFMERALSMRFLETVSKRIRSKHVLMVFDSCFSGAIFALNKAVPSPYIEEKVSRKVREFITAGTESEQVPDRSVFNICFLQAVKDGYADRNRDGYVTGEELGAYLQEKVVNYSNKAQHPQFGKINNPKLDKGDFVFAASQGDGPAAPARRRPTGRLEVRCNVSGARVRILNIREKYRPGMELAPGRYHVEVTARGYEAHHQWIELSEGEYRSVEIRLAEKEPKPGDTWTDPVTGMEFVWIPGGCFRMGSPPGEWGRDGDEGPMHEVCVDGFWMGKYEVTNGQYRKFDPDHRTGEYKGMPLNGDDQPVVKVTWEDAVAYAEWLTRRARQRGKRFEFRLPTEAEWEYACRAGTRTSRFWGDDPDKACRYTNAYDSTAKRRNEFPWPEHKCRDGYPVTAPVGRYKPNPFGLYDMLGNVWEWCLDVYAPDAYAGHSRRNPVYTGSGPKRILRGGSWDCPPWYLRCASRFISDADSTYAGMGFRLQRSP